MSKQVANVLRTLKGFEQADTNSQVEGVVEPAKYPVLDTKKNHPTPDTDYIMIEALHLGGNDTWICSRWKDQEYAVIEQVPEPEGVVSFEDDPDAIDEQVIVGLLPAFHPFTYDLDYAAYPFALPGIKLPLAPPAQNNCCTLVEGVTVGAWAEAKEEFTWTSAQHGQMMIYSPEDFFSPVTALIDANMAVAVQDPDAAPNPWTVVQGWRNQWRGGHTFFIVAHHVPTDRVLTLESNSAYNMNGPGFRCLGNLRDFPEGRPPENWWENDSLFTWERIKSTYRFRQQCWLKVKNLSWARG